MTERRTISRWRWLACALALAVCAGAGAADDFTRATTAYRAGEFATAAEGFARAARVRPAAGTYLNLGLAEWDRGRRGHAVLAWERALWLAPDLRAAEENLRYARQQLQLPAPELAWHEVASTWLPFNAWAWLAGASLWLAVGMVTVPAWCGRRRRGWHQAVAAAGLAAFLMCLPAMLGVWSRSRLAVVLERNTPLRLTPTADAQRVSLLAAGEPVRVERRRGDYWLVRGPHGRGWVEAAELGRVAE